MTRQQMALQGTLALALIVGIVGGNFILHRWMLGNTTSREADAGVAETNPLPDDLAEFAPTRRSSPKAIDPEVQRQRLRQLIVRKLPNASDQEREDWLEELGDVPLSTAEGILDLRSELEKMKANDTPTDDWSKQLNWSIPLTR